MNTCEATERRLLRMDKEFNMTTKGRIKHLTWPALVQEARETYDLIYGRNACYGTKDLVYLDMIEREIFRREEIDGCEHHFTYREK